MPVRSATDFYAVDDLTSPHGFSNEPSSDTLLSYDIWKKFGLDTGFPEFDDIGDMLNELDFLRPDDSLFADVVDDASASYGLRLDDDPLCEIRNHDCMWAGHCGSKEHPVDEPEPRALSTERPHTQQQQQAQQQQQPKTTLLRVKSRTVPVLTNQAAAAALLTTSGGTNKTTPPSSSSSAAPAVAGHKMSSYAAPDSVLKSNYLRNAGVPVIDMITPQTPPMSDDEENKSKTGSGTTTQVLQIFDDAISEFDPEELCEYFEQKVESQLDELEELEEEEEEEEEEEDEEEDDDDDEEEDEGYEEQRNSTRYSKPETPIARANRYATEIDHSYHKDRNACMRMDGLGIETPSDSEEEIDVVSVVDKYNPNNRIMGCALPTNPSRSDRRHLQRTVASAITNNSNNRNKNNNNNTTTNGIKTLLPNHHRKNASPPSPDYSPAKRRQNNNSAQPRTSKRPRQYRTNNGPSPFKRRATTYGNSSDSEQEPSEKRSMHNNMERQRRIDLRNAFEYLRQLVPEVAKKDRAAKVAILREAAKYCDNLTYTSMSLNKQVEDQKRYQERLRMRVSSLRRNLASKR